MPEGQILLNSIPYVIVPFERSGRVNDVHRYTVDPLGTVFRTAGQHRQEDIRTSSAFIFPNLQHGFGRERINSDSAFKVDEYRRFRDATADTRWAADIRLPILAEDSTETGLEVIRASADWKGLFLGLWEDGTSTDILVKTYDGSDTTWDAHGTVLDSSDTMVGLDMAQASGRLLVLFAQTNDHHVYNSSGDGSSWAAASTDVTQNLLANNVTANEEIDAGLIAPGDIGGEAVVALWNEGSNQIQLLSSTDGGDTWAAEGAAVRSSNGPQGIAIYPDIDGDDKLYLGTAEGLWMIDTGPSTWTHTLVFPMSHSVMNCRRMTVHNGALWFSQGVDDDSPAPIFRMTVSGDARVFDTGLGLDAGDSVPAELLGPIRWMKSAQGMLFISIGGGAASRNARVLCHNNKGWHSIVRHGTANKEIQWIDTSALDDGTPRLHYAVRTADSTSDTKFVAHPLANPSSGVEIKRETSGYVDLPYIDKGLPFISGTWFRVGINHLDAPATTSEYINFQYGLDDGSGGLQARTTTTLGTFFATTFTRLIASGAGVSSTNFGCRVTLNRGGTNTNTPRLRDVALDVLPQPSRFEGWVVRVDIDATARLLDSTPESVITNLQTARDLATLAAYQYGSTSTTYVVVRDLEWLESVTHPSGEAIEVVTDSESQRTGIAELRLEEII